MTKWIIETDNFASGFEKDLMKLLIKYQQKSVSPKESGK